MIGKVCKYVLTPLADCWFSIMNGCSCTLMDGELVVLRSLFHSGPTALSPATSVLGNTTELGSTSQKRKSTSPTVLSWIRKMTLEMKASAYLTMKTLLHLW